MGLTVLDEAKAMLATPLGLVVAWLLLDRAEELLGKQKFKPTVSSPDAECHNIPKDLAPTYM